MCNSGNCRYERFDGTCKGRPRGPLSHVPACMEPEDMDAYNESADDDRVLAYDLDREEARIPYC